jgi:cysteine-rich repeat protein
MQFPNRYRFPGIDGLINLYDSFYVPATLTGLDISLHVNSSASPLFLNIGNVTVFNRTTNDKELISINDATLSSILDYDSLSKRTIPIRLGLENVSFVGITKEIDVFSVTDLSWSMNGQMMTDAKSANNLLIDILLNNQGNRVGLVGYESLARDSDFHLLSSNSASLKSVISNQWNAGGQTCICCGINKATTYFISPLGSMSGGSIQSRVSTSNDDAEERVSDGDMTRNSQELELVYDIYNGGDQFVGMRFGNINIPAGATIVNAHIEFISKQTNSGVTHLTFSAEDIDSASSFSNSNYDISSRQKTNSQVNWSNVPSWNFGEIYQTPDLSGMIQEVVDRAGWSNGNSVVVIVNGSGQRTAFSFNSAGGAFAPLLVINYSLAPLTCGNGIIDVGEECDDGNSNNNDACTNLCTDAVCGDGAVWNLGGSEQCDDGGICTGDDFTLCIKDSDCSVVGGVCTQRNGDGCSISCQTEDRFKSMVVMSDGNANVECLEQNTGNAGRDAIEAACTAWNTYGIQVNAVGFGSEANESTLQAIAVCGNGSYYFSDVAGLGEVYEQIANQIIASYTEQTLKVEGDLQSRLFEDSYIDFTYNKPPFPTGLVLSLESNFSDSFSGSFSVPDDSIVIETRATSYSGPRWTDNFEVDGNSVYALSDYGSSYASLGDPFIVNMPNSLATTGIHFVNLTTGVAPGNSSNGSIYNKVIVTIVKNASSFSEIKPVAKGCVWSIEFLGGGTTSINIPGAYTGSSVCSYNSLSISYDPNDAFQEAAFILLSRLDFDSNGIVDFAFVEDDLSFSLDEVTGIPFTWSSEVHARIWY